MLLLDTNIVSYILKKDSRADWYKAYLQGHHQAISVITVAELFRWGIRYQWGQKRLSQLETTLNQDYLILPLTYDLCWAWAQVVTENQQKGQPIDAHDAWIAATALYHNIPLMTHNVKDFAAVNNLSLITSP